MSNSTASTTTLTEVDLSNKQLSELPKDIIALTGIRKLNAGNNNLSDLPSELDQWLSIRILFFLNNRFSFVPAVIAKLSSLYMLSFKSCLLTEIPEHSLPSQLVWLILTDNRISSLPSSFSYSLSNVRKLMLASNEIQILPDMSGFQALELVRLSDNQLTTVNGSNLFRLPKLAWLALGGNPCTTVIRNRSQSVPTFASSTEGNSTLISLPDIPLIPFKDIEIGKELGQGASGTVYRGIWKQVTVPSNRIMTSNSNPNGNNSNQTITKTVVAIKLFKPASSDGKPEDEVDIALHCSHYGITNTDGTIGPHPNFIQIIGYISEPSTDNNNSKVLGLVLEYLPSTEEAQEEGWTILARPPSFDTVTRDTFPIIPGSRINPPFTLNTIYNICKGVCSVLQYLHSIQVVHGDVYAHNIMIQPNGNAKLGDLGAAFIYPFEYSDSIISSTFSSSSSAAIYSTESSLLQYLEVRGYGCLIDDLLQQSFEYQKKQHSNPPIAETPIYLFLNGLRDHCLLPSVPSDRPTFSQIVDEFQTFEISLHN